MAPAKTADFSVNADLGELRRASHWLEQTCNELNIPSAQISRLDLCLNEVLANILTHGNEAAHATPVTLTLSVQPDCADTRATLTIEDAGSRFDPVEAVPSPRPGGLAEAETGGLGIVMIRNNADSISYQYTENCNRFSVSVVWPKAGYEA